MSLSADKNKPVPVTGLRPDRLVGQLIDGRYLVSDLVNSGGMGAVYRAKHSTLGKIKAIKVLKQSALTNESNICRFVNEAKAASTLDHPNLVNVHDFGVTPEGEPYLVMDYVEGESLSELLRSKGRLNAEVFVTLLTQICSGLQYAHQKGIVHRDIKPSNIIVSSTAGGATSVKIVDFGIAKISNQPWQEQQITKTGEIFGSPAYMSPEQCMGNREVDERSDIYSLGCVCFEALTGLPPFRGSTAMQTMYKHIHESKTELPWSGTKSSLFESLESIVLRCLEKDPSRRYQNITELQADIERACDGESLCKYVIGTDQELASEFTGIASWKVLDWVQSLTSWMPWGPRNPAINSNITNLRRGFLTGTTSISKFRGGLLASAPRTISGERRIPTGRTISSRTRKEILIAVVSFFPLLTMLILGSSSLSALFAPPWQQELRAAIACRDSKDFAQAEKHFALALSAVDSSKENSYDKAFLHWQYAEFIMAERKKSSAASLIRALPLYTNAAELLGPNMGDRARRFKARCLSREGDCEYHLRLYEASISSYKNALSLLSISPSPQAAQLNYAIGLACEHLAKFKEAISYFHAALSSKIISHYTREHAIPDSALGIARCLVKEHEYVLADKAFTTAEDLRVRASGASNVQYTDVVLQHLRLLQAMSQSVDVGPMETARARAQIQDYQSQANKTHTQSRSN